jgi:fluoroquinolone transport system permease protein
MIIGITAFYMVVIYFLKDLGNIEKFTTLLIFNEPTMVGFVFIGLAVILEKDQEVLSALFITPINHHFYLISRILTLSSISMICAWGMVLMAKGTSFNLLHFSVGAFSSCILFSFVGIYIVSYTTEILHFILRSIPLIIVMSLPFLNYFEITDFWILKLFPVQGNLYLIDNSYSNSPNISELTFGYISISIWIPLLYWFVYKTFKSKLVNA